MKFRRAITKEYIDDMGRKKSVYQDGNYIPMDMYRGEYVGEDLDIMGDRMGIPRDIKNAKLYIAKAPNLAIGYMDLGNAYFQAEMYDKAFETYQKGFNLATNKNEQYDFVYNMSLICLKLGDKDKALEYAEYAKSLKVTDEILKYIHDIRTPWGLGNSRF